MIGKLETAPALTRPDLLATVVAEALRSWAPEAASRVLVAPIDPDLADTTAFCAAYDVGPDQSANCVVVSGKRGGETRFAACVVLATTRVDVNGAARRHLDVRKASFAPMDLAVAETGMEYGGITPVGLPDWPVLIDDRVAVTPHVIIGSGVRRGKLVIPGVDLASMVGAEVLEALARPVV